jgi:GT2 family glycosyltransferase
LCVAASGTTEAAVADVVATSSRRVRSRTTVLSSPPDANGLLNELLDRHRGDALALLFPGDVWAPDTVALLADALQPDGVAYADEDVMEAEGRHRAPRLKPGHSPDFLLATGYVGRPLAVGPAVSARLPRLDASGPAELEHELALAATAAARRVAHVAEVLCHRLRAPEHATDVAHVVRALHRAGENPTVRHDGRTYVVDRAVAHGTSVSIVIPFRDAPRFLRTCVESVDTTTRDLDRQFVLVDNGSIEPETTTLLEHLETRPDVVVVHDPRPFNWAALNNAGAASARGEVLVFLNNDIEAHQSGWLAALCAQARRTDVAAVGARLLYPDRRLQHCGLVVGLGGAAGHHLAGLADDAAGYLDMAIATREVSAVTGACLATRRDVFDRLGGFDEQLGVDLNDVDYCLRARAEGLRTLYEPRAELVHHESPSRGTAGGVGDIVDFVQRWKGYIGEGDSYYNAHLTRADASCALAGAEEEDAWNRWYSSLLNG